MPTTINSMPTAIYEMPTTINPMPTAIYKMPTTINPIPTAIYEMPTTINPRPNHGNQRKRYVDPEVLFSSGVRKRQYDERQRQQRINEVK
jgi:hypothetical protein